MKAVWLTPQTIDDMARHPKSTHLFFLKISKKKKKGSKISTLLYHVNDCSSLEATFMTVAADFVLFF